MQPFGTLKSIKEDKRKVSVCLTCNHVHMLTVHTLERSSHSAKEINKQIGHLPSFYLSLQLSLAVMVTQHITSLQLPWLLWDKRGDRRGGWGCGRTTCHFTKSMLLYTLTVHCCMCVCLCVCVVCVCTLMFGCLLHSILNPLPFTWTQVHHVVSVCVTMSHYFFWKNKVTEMTWASHECSYPLSPVDESSPAVCTALSLVNMHYTNVFHKCMNQDRKSVV